MSLSKMKVFLQARLEEESLVLALSMVSAYNEVELMATDCKFSFYSLENISSTQSQFLRLADQRLSDEEENPGVSIPLTEICGNSLSVKFEGVILSEDYKQFTVKKPDSIQWPFKWMVKMFNEKSYSDAQIQVGGEAFKVHRVILAAASPVFYAMFESGMQERQGTIKISDFDPAVVGDLLAFIYTGEAPNLKTLAKELLLAADKYDVQNLACACMKYLGDQLTSSNVADILHLAEKLPSDNLLKNNCVKYIQDNLYYVCESKSWKVLKETCKDLVVDTM